MMFVRYRSYWCYTDSNAILAFHHSQEARMAVPVLPIIKAVAPYIAQVATAAIPAFTSKPEAVKVDPVLSQQIEELQAAATQNAQSVHVLAENLQQMMQEAERAAQEAKKQAAAYRAMLFVSLGLSTLSLLTSIYLLLG